MAKYLNKNKAQQDKFREPMEFLEATTEVNVNKDVYHIYMGRKYMLLNRRLIEINPLQFTNMWT